MTQQIFAYIVGISRNYLSEVENYKGKIPLEIIVGIATNMPEISLVWLLTGQGSMYRHDGINSGLRDNEKINCPEWLKEWWEKAGEEEKNWLKVELKKFYC